MQAAAPAAYGEATETYRRCVAGGRQPGGQLRARRVPCSRRLHTRLVLCGGASQAEATGIELVAQDSGTFAGSKVPFEALPGPGETTSTTSGFSYLTNVCRTPTKVAALTRWTGVSKMPVAESARTASRTCTVHRAHPL